MSSDNAAITSSISRRALGYNLAEFAVPFALLTLAAFRAMRSANRPEARRDGVGAIGGGRLASKRSNRMMRLQSELIWPVLSLSRVPVAFTSTFDCSAPRWWSAGSAHPAW